MSIFFLSPHRFRLAAAYVEEIHSPDNTPESVKESLENVPLKQREAYERQVASIFRHSTPFVRQHGARALYWMYSSDKEFDRDEFLAVMSQDPEKGSGEEIHLANRYLSVRKLLSCCQGLVVFDTKKGKWQFSHPTVRMYLREPNTGSLFDPTAARLAVAKVALRMCCKIMAPVLAYHPDFEIDCPDQREREVVRAEAKRSEFSEERLEDATYASVVEAAMHVFGEASSVLKKVRESGSEDRLNQHELRVARVLFKAAGEKVEAE
jgi:hypothetical protein